MSAKKFSEEPENARNFTETFDNFYTSTAGLYNFAVKVLPFWKRWLNLALPYIRGNRVIEVSFGTGYLMTKFSGDFETYGIDYNLRMIEVARQNLKNKGMSANLQQGDVEHLPYNDSSFDTIVNTMSFTGYPDSVCAIMEMNRVLRPGGRLILIDINYPSNGNRIGVLLTRFWQISGDIIRDMGQVFEEGGFAYEDQEIGGFGSVHLYLCEKI
jgi:ubiquinone/menaquinone biosynthesis C-methylase UbiE